MSFKVKRGWVEWRTPVGGIYDHPVPRSRAEAERWIRHMAEKSWVSPSDLSTFAAAMRSRTGA